ncbi:uroporphyrinogen-III C-methyltransferase [Enemella evansiae]|uniref:uroporphyrinogen-III C-methyltransferase n=1 Tax=Enemella evansiae TaxID=2016499 RepID=UPI000B96CEEF|nr:uroporphyrinogen-III C-methyltransferase [Enemella evansiae]OYO05382.1 uroporphyrinogen-III C-methyltransferase [Enemella evansiae]
MFPLSLELRGRRVLVVGGGRIAARRVRDLLAAGARIDLVAPELCPELAELGERIGWQAREFRDSDLVGAWLVHVATGDQVVDARVARLAEEHRIFCVAAGAHRTGTASVPAHTSVELPDTRVQLAVSSADPRRSVAIRNRIAGALASDPGDLRPQREHPGWVALVGGGPGDDGLLTRRGVQLLATADVVVVDRLAPHGVLADLPDGVEVIDVGKTPGHHPVPQHEINALLVEHAQQGRGVVRLKGGDPFVLGRGEEERAACQAAGVRVEVVPGISSAIAVPAAAGIPVTSRGVSRGFTVVTGHEELAEVPSRSDHTVVVLMGVKGLARTARTLIAGGRAADCPVAIVERGCTPQQRVTVAPLDRIAEFATECGVTSPAVVVIGEVVRLGPDWSEAYPDGRGADIPAILTPQGETA